ncbi:MAG TPA: 30S ribosomal protein S9 [Candidatus Paceibacterota bacterium]|jgi:small subunit ribosomal protein S9|nr:30S ribosomal protein S9 [Candidatus Paceibacterota bacterium]
MAEATKTSARSAAADKKEKYIEAVGRRKTAVARVRLVASSKMAYTVNGKELEIYFPTDELQRIVRDPFTAAKDASKFKITAKIVGGGIHSQAEALRHGIARALIKSDMELRKKIKKAGFLERDQRAKERRKFGLKKARKAPQWSKR